MSYLISSFSGTLIIHILDVNDKAPAFASPWSPETPFFVGTVLEEAPIGSPVLTVMAFDPESGISQYNISGVDADYFEIDQRTGNSSTAYMFLSINSSLLLN